MSDFVRMMDSGAAYNLPIHSASASAAAAASLSLADANFDGVKLVGYNTVTNKNNNCNRVSMGERIWSWLIGIVAIVGVATSLLAMWLEASWITYIAFCVPLVTGPVLILQRKKLQWMPTFRDESNKLRIFVNELAVQRIQLEMEVGRMVRQVQRMSAIEQRFDQVVQREGKSVPEFRQLVQENAKIQTEIKKQIAAKDLLDLFSLIMSTDRNEDNSMTGSEAQEFILRVRDFAGRRGKALDETVILDYFKHSNGNSSMNNHCPASLFNIVQSALSDDMQEKPNDEENLPGANNNLPEVTTGGEQHQSKEERRAEDDAVQLLHKVPRVAPTGLVLSESKDDEGNLAHPIKVDHMMSRDMFSHDNHFTTSVSDDSNQHLSSEEEDKDFLSMILNSASALGIY